MFLRCKSRKKNGKEHRYWSIVENKRGAGNRVVQRHVLYLGEINDHQEAAWQRAIEVFPEGEPQPRTVALFPADRAVEAQADATIVRVRLSEMALRKPRQFGACWLACHVYHELGLDRFWADRLPRNPTEQRPSRSDQRHHPNRETQVPWRRRCGNPRTCGPRRLPKQVGGRPP